jgi:uncharacterized protein
MVRSVRRQLPVIFIFFIFVFSVHAPSVFSGDSKSFLWKIQSKTNTVFLLGSIHLFKKEFYPLNKNIEDAFDQSAIVVVEANVSSGRQIDLQQLVGKAIYADDDTLEKHVSRETFELIRRRTEGLGVPFELINKQKPWFLGLMFSSVEFLKLGFDPNYGIDKHFLSKAVGKKQIVELESLDYQINLLSDLSDQNQELFLVLSFKDLDTLGRDVDKFLQAWASGDTKEIERIMTQSVAEDSRLSPIYQKIIDDRNKNMASKIEDFLKTKETYFVIIGAGHLVGEKGIVEILNKKGYQVDQL